VLRSPLGVKLPFAAKVTTQILNGEVRIRLSRASSMVTFIKVMIFVDRPPQRLG
jgi:hypothetical protein